MGILTAHHWTDLGGGLSEMRRVARRRIVMVTFDPGALAGLWIVPELSACQYWMRHRL